MGSTGSEPLPGVVGMIDAKGSNSSYAIYGEGQLIAWGLNTNGQAGINLNSYNPNRPEYVTVGPTGDFLTNITTISAGGYHVLAVKSGGTVWAWGLNTNGRLGDGSTTQRTIPVQVKTTLSPITYLRNVSDISAGGSHSMALDSDGNVWVWGLNSSGQLGDGLTTQRTSPFQVPGLSKVSVISAGAEHSLALVRDIATSRDIIYSWGRNTSGQLGDGTNNNSSSPVKVQLPVMEMF